MNHRLIARLDIKGPNIIKGIHLEGLRIVGNPQKFANKYYKEGIDEIIYIDIVASLYERNNLTEIVKHTAQNVFIPLTVGGGVRTLEDVNHLLKSGADKIAINTAAIRRPEFIKEVAYNFGSQCIVLSIEAKRKGKEEWEAYTENGREKTGLDAVEWAMKGAELGAGEILITSVDQEGTRKGFDVNLIRTISEKVPVPVIASGGMGTINHLLEVIHEGKADAVAMADVLHYEKLSIQDIRKAGVEAGLLIREC